MNNTANSEGGFKIEFIQFWIFEDGESLLVSLFPYASHTVLT